MQQWNSQLYDSQHAFVFRYGEDLLAWLNPQPNERILDLGCGTGHLTAKIAETGAQVTGFDQSEQMITTARENYQHIPFRVDDARTFRSDEPLDAVFSNAVLHWIPEADQVIDSIYRALKPGGRFVAEFGGKGNIAVVIGSLQRAVKATLGLDVSPTWYFPSVSTYATLLEERGFEVSQAALFDRFTPLEAGEHGLRAWYQMFGAHLLKYVPADQLDKVMRQTEEYARPTLYRDGRWHADYRRLRIQAVKVG